MRFSRSGPSHWYLVDPHTGKKTRVSKDYVLQHKKKKKSTKRGSTKKKTTTKRGSTKKKKQPAAVSFRKAVTLLSLPVARVPKRRLAAIKRRVKDECFGYEPDFAGTLFWLADKDAAEPLDADGIYSLCVVHESTIYNVCTPMHARNHGYATSMLKALVKWWAQNHKTRLRLTVRKENKSAVAVYKKVGFKVREELVDGVLVMSR